MVATLKAVWSALFVTDGYNARTTYFYDGRWN